MSAMPPPRRNDAGGRTAAGKSMRNPPGSLSSRPTTAHDAAPLGEVGDPPPMSDARQRRGVGYSPNKAGHAP